MGQERVTEVKKCTCIHSFQDERYGKGMRVMTPRKLVHRCTVCGAIHK